MAKLYFYYSAMNAGKSTSLLQSAYNYKERGMRPYIMSAAIDNRYSVGKVTSRIGLEAEAYLFHKEDDLFKILSEENKKQGINCVLIDESQFLSRDQVKQLAIAVDDLDIPVLCYGIRTDFRGELFPGSQHLLAWADNLIELKTICHCGSKATMVVRTDEKGNIINDGDQVVIGGNDRYQSMCRKHFAEHIWSN
ncbi:thymidine kinase [Candidatus Thioglobus sp.]|uniref:thymidine kinase n=1 Tax=unclassified Candidatus Pseudothioglobus TaxID=3072908 RepID=UPI0023354DA8|nr:thymidine kinase [Candidatus Thioglobus sp.]MDB9788456.1 thymidine kinase [Candidatus Thioglobus sp.]MDB9864421.1 thymidine kinase [Candidatus Thioglobus sp.]MDB9938700.1 thymidine kinase [Candidatus Thioglobus sp.]MDB9975218.1 thymidine kinase [Candidatus Thioglobus sp.]